MRRAVDEMLHSFQTFAEIETEYQCLRFGNFISVDVVPGTHWAGPSVSGRGSEMKIFSLYI